MHTLSYASTRLTQAASLCFGILLIAAGCRDPNELEGGGSVSVRATPRAGSQSVGGNEMAPDSVRAVVHGSGVNVGTKLSAGANGSYTGTIKNVPAGTYHVIVEGLVGGETELYGVTSGVVVEAGKTAETSPSFGSFVPTIGDVPQETMTPRFKIVWGAIAGADSYSVEMARSADFAGATRFVSTTPEVMVTLSDSGAHFVRGRALSGFVQRSRASSAATVKALVNASEPSDNTPGNATALGFGVGASGTYSGFNILPAGDRDWFSVGLCAGDELQVGVKAARMDPPSSLNSHLQMRDPRDTVVAANNDFEGSDDSYVSHLAAMNGVYRVSVSAAEGSAGRVGQYELLVSVISGPNAVAGGCRAVLGSTVARVAVSPETSGLSSLGATQTFSASVLDAGGTPVPGKTVVWASSNPTVATIGSGTGTVSAVGTGQTIITASSDGVLGFALLNVSASGAGAVGSWTAVNSGANHHFTGVFGTSPAELFGVVGANGSMVRLSGGAWSQGTSGVFGNLSDIWGFGPGNWFAVGANGAIVRHDGTSGTAMASGTTQPLNGIWGSSHRNLWAVGGGGVILWFNGSRWISVTTPTNQSLNAVFGLSAGNVYAVGNSGTVLRFDGTNWSSQNSGTTSDLYGVWGSAANDIWAVGAGGTILHNNGTGWSAVGSGTSARLNAVWGTSSSDAYAVGSGGTILRFNGVSWSAQTSGTSKDLHGVWGSFSGSVYAVGADGTILRGVRGVGNAAARIDVSPPASQAASGTVAFTAQAFDGSGNALTGKTFTWTTLNPDVATIGSASGIATVTGSGQTVVAATVDGAVGYAVITAAVTGAVPVGRFVNVPLVASPALNDVWGINPSLAFAVGNSGVMLRYDGASWSQVPSGASANLNAIWAASASSAFAVGAGGTIVTFDGASWQQMTSGTSLELLGVWGASPADVFAVGNSGTILHYNGATWASMSGGTNSTLLAVWGTSPNSVYAVGAGGTIIRYDGSRWSPMASGTSATLRGIWGTSDNTIIAVGDNGTVLRFDGGSWTAMTVPEVAHYHDVWGSSAGDVYAVGAGGRIIRFNGSSWRGERSPTPHDLNGAWGAPGGSVFFVGNTGAVIAGRRGPAWITVSPDAVSLATGTARSFSAQAFDSDGNIITRPITWSSLNPVILSLSASGTATALSAGQAVVAATADGISGYALITVAAATPAPVTGWTAVSSGTSQTLRGIWAQAPDHAYAVGAGGSIVQWNGSSWRAMGSGTSETLNGIWGASPSTVWIVGVDAGKLKLTTNGWEVAHLPRTAERNAIWGASPDALFSVGDSGATLRYDGWGWAVTPSGTTRNLRGVWGTSSTNVIAVGANGTIIRWNGVAWSAMPTSGSWRGLRAVWGTGPDNAYAVGDTGTIIRWNGSTWSSMTSGTLVNLNGITGTSAGDIYAFGDGGVILRYNGTTWAPMSNPAGSSALYSGWGVGSSIWVVGSGGAILRGTR